MNTLDNLILEAVRQWPDVTMAELQEVIDYPVKKSISPRVSMLVSMGHLMRKKVPNPVPPHRGRQPFIYAYSIGDGTPQPLKPCHRHSPTPAGLEARMAEMESRLQELSSWREEAIARYPDLAVPPIILRARKIVEEVYCGANDPAGAKEVHMGRRDQSLIMKAVCLALEETI